MSIFYGEVNVKGHKVTLEVNNRRSVIILVDDWVGKIDDTDKHKRLKLALAARRLWQSALGVLPPGVYSCTPSSKSRRKLYLAAGWRSTPLPRDKGDLVYYHQIPPLPEGWMNWMP